MKVDLTKKIYLVGMPGAGKSYFAKKIAEELNRTLIDLDKIIEEKEGPISEIFKVKGESYFRDVEAKTLREISHAYSDAVISTGGGTPCFHNGMDYMNAHGVTVFLETTIKTLIERLSGKIHRPLIRGNTEKHVLDLLEKRHPIYQHAHITIMHRDIETLIKELTQLEVKSKGS